MMKEGIDYYLNENGLMVLTAHFLEERGYCCESGCVHCPYGDMDGKKPSLSKEKLCVSKKVKNETKTEN